MNAIRLGGLLCAGADGLYALYVLVHYADDPAGQPPCRRFNSTNAQFGVGSGSDGTSLRLVNDYTTFFCLLLVNALGIACGTSLFDSCESEG